MPVLILPMISRLEAQIIQGEPMHDTGTAPGQGNPDFLTSVRHGVKWWAT
ncbi:hypothetical protein [Aquicoccus sp.]